ncbi:hypothetical protein Fmac_032308 [Flemingia macrophylla]|uniref:Uncharacterized protein n=1 Tax=Flemingia macrophylla TaxID=520843 RepID=A0ABD1L4K7_9FABA
MDISGASQYSSASESGWTHYLDQSSLSENYFQKRGGIAEYEGKGARMEESEEDLSMVSDASSGPPHFDNQCYCKNWYPCISSTTKEHQKKKKTKEYGRSKQSSPLDDTASSPVFNCSKDGHKVNVNLIYLCLLAEKKIANELVLLLLNRSKTVSQGMEQWRVNWTLYNVYLQQEQREDKIQEALQFLREHSC